MQILEKLNACPEAIKWASGRDPEKAWHECPRGDWLLWLVEKLGVDEKLIRLSACDCAELTVHLCKDERSRKAIEVTRAWVAGEATIAQVREASENARAAWIAAYRDGNYKAGDAAYAAIANTAWLTAAYASWASSDREETLSKCADIVRKHISWEELCKLTI